MISKAFGPNSIAVTEQQLSFEEAVERAVALLEIDDRVTAAYRAEVLQNLRDLGPYFVVAPGIALAHARPSENVKTIGFSLLRSTLGTSSGSENDPVYLVFAFCTPNPDAHIELLGEFAAFISKDEMMKLLLNASAESVIRELIQGRELN